MAEVYFPDEIDNFIASLGSYQVDVLTDLFLISKVGPESLDFCEASKGGIWIYRRLVGPSSFAFLLFTHYEASDSYLVLHGIRAGPEGPTKYDLRYARRRRKAD